MSQQEHSILVVDDEPDIRETVADLLREEGYAVEEARNGRVALDRMRAGAVPRLVLTDVMMPELSGPELLRCIRSDETLRRVAVVLMTAAAREWLPADVPCLLKPLTMEELLRIVQEQMRPPALESVG